jgi:hypothetical protein
MSFLSCNGLIGEAGHPTLFDARSIERGINLIVNLLTSGGNAVNNRFHGPEVDRVLTGLIAETFPRELLDLLSFGISPLTYVCIQVMHVSGNYLAGHVLVRVCDYLGDVGDEEVTLCGTPGVDLMVNQWEDLVE